MLAMIAMQPQNSEVCVSETRSNYDDQALQDLAKEVLLLAVRDAIKGKPYDMDHARYWLASAAGAVWATLAGYDPAAVRAWVKAGCLQPTSDQLKRKPARLAPFLTTCERNRLGINRQAKGYEHER